MALGIKKFLDKQKVFRRYGRFDDEVLLIASEDGNASCLRILLESGKNINFQGRNGQSPLHRAIIHQQFECIRFLIQQHANLNLKDNLGKTPLMHALESGEKHIFYYLLDHYPDLEIGDQMGETILFKTIRQGETTLARRLIELGANVNHQNVKKETPLMAAVDHEKVGIVKSLLQHEADPTLADENGQTVLDRNIPTIRIKRIIQKASVQHKIGEHDDHLNLAENLMANDIDIVPLANGLLNQFPRLSALFIGLADGIYANLNEQYDLQGLEKKGKEVIQQLENFAESSIRERKNVVNGKAPVDKNTTKQFELNHALIEAVQKDTFHLVELLLKLGANPNFQDKDKKTALHYAENNDKFVELLLKHKADPWIEDKDGNSPYLIAQQNEWTSTLSLIKSK